MIRIFVEDNELDINASFTHQITYAVNDLQNLDSKATAFTKTIVLPGTANNNKIFGNIFEFANSNFTVDGDKNIGYNFNASKSAKARIDSDGLTIMKGVIRMLEIIVDGHLIEYEVALFGELGGFISKLAANKITENDNANNNLDFSEYNHTYSIANITGSWNNILGNGYFYPLIDYGNVSTDKVNFQYQTFRPAIYVKEIISKIIAKAGYTWESNFFNTAFFNRLIVPNNDKALYKKSTSNFITAIKTTDQRVSAPQGTFPSQQNFQGANIQFDSITLNNFTHNNGVFTYTQTSTTIKLTGNIKGITKIVASRNQIQIRLYKNGNIINNIFYGVVNPNQQNFSVDFDVNIDLVLNDIIYFVFIAQSGNKNPDPFTPPIYDTTYIEIQDATVTAVKDPPGFVEYQIGDTMLMNDVLPKNILQKDFFTSIMKMFNLMVTEDKFVEKKLIIEPYVDFYDLDRTTYIDWSDKVDKSLPIHIKPMSEVNARYYQFSFKQDNDYYNDLYRKKYNQNYGDRVFDNNLEFAKETQKNEVIFSSTVLVGYNGTDKILSTIFKKQNNIEDKTESVIRILQSKKITGVSNWYIKNGATNISSALTSYGYAGHFDNPDVPAADLNFGATNELYFTLAAGALSNNLFNAYYSGYMAEITDKDSRLITVRMRLKNKDIFNLDFGKFIWIDGVLYRLIKIYDYAEGELCKVDLLRVIYTTYYL